MRREKIATNCNLTHLDRENIYKRILVKLMSLKHWVISGKEICFPRLGCFSDDSPWAGISERPLKILPWDPKDVNTRFLLYTNENQDNYQELTADASIISDSNFKTDRKTRFIIHGFIDKGEESWLSNMCKNMFQVESVNCICIDWKSGSRTGYTQASQNVRIVGAEVAYFIETLQSSFGYSLSNVHIIGHSLGSHAAGEAGRRTNGTVGRITGLDPAEPCFEGTPELVRLDPSDAQFVDVIHTDAGPFIPNLGFGMSQTAGHLDFFPNGGVHMPGCNKNILSQIVDIDGIWAGWRYKVSFTLSGKKVTGHVMVSLFGNKGNSKQYEVFKGKLSPDSTHSSEFDSDVDVGDVQRVKFIWYNNVINPTLPKVGASKITVERNDGKLDYSLGGGIMPVTILNIRIAKADLRIQNKVPFGDWHCRYQPLVTFSSPPFDLLKHKPKILYSSSEESTFLRKEVCYESLGCFSDSEPWGGTAIRPLKVQPWSPEKIGTRFLLYTNENPNSFQILQPSDPSTIEASNFQTNRKTRFIIHGFIDKGDESWLVDMCKNMFTVEEVNCICVDWKKGSQTTYFQAANNVRVVGAQVAQMLSMLSTNYSYSPSQVHIIGHSLGAHGAGEAGSRTPGLSRITGLDPVEASFEGTSNEVRLDPSDADFVDVIHTDSAPLIPFLGFGTNQLMGHLDFFPNGGENMPGCKKNILSQIVDLDGIWEGTRDFVACNHLRSYKYYSESILNPDGFAAYPCASYKAFESDKCFPCPDEGCPQMGHYADKFANKTSEEQQKFFLNTGESSKFSRSTHSKEFDVELDIGTVEKVKFLWNNNVINPTFPKVGAARITVQKGEGRNVCRSGHTLQHRAGSQRRPKLERGQAPVLSTCLPFLKRKEICYEPFGCFSNEKPWAGILQRPLKILPWAPKDINTQFLLYTNENPNNYQLISVTDLNTIEASNFHMGRKTRFIIHGFLGKGEESWLSDMCKDMFKVEQVNCICVDWKRGARTGYTQAVQNIRVVGAEVAYLIHGLLTELGYRLEDVHIIGHSLGAHAAGEAGRRLGGQVGRISGLDPAQPCFQGAPEQIRLDSSDALFVDVIHTDTSPFIPNFGTRDFVACNHLRVYKYYSSSILNPDGFLGYPCASYSEFEKNNCFPCPDGGCPKMGHFADQFQGKTNAVGQTFFLNTGDSGDFTRWRYKVSVTLSGKKKVNGYVRIALYGSDGNSKQYQIFKGSLKPDANHVTGIDLDFDIGKIEKVKFLWNNHVINLFQPKLGASQITVQSSDGTDDFGIVEAAPRKCLNLPTSPPCVEEKPLHQADRADTEGQKCLLPCQAVATAKVTPGAGVELGRPEGLSEVNQALGAKSCQQLPPPDRFKEASLPDQEPLPPPGFRTQPTGGQLDGKGGVFWSTP
ncbi:Inactive pancreatic lipase-related protein 1 [Galemys pyrenaicus]|uniref:Triacylglycerol lipase n=1 Tax=Galemys pyrenaicus TaxID=202257 RepID=A0A8J6A978_GALPY|nr:Inactive pancreatic lipase-related protein 1 [Galemys pyrenaicus]